MGVLRYRNSPSSVFALASNRVNQTRIEPMRTNTLLGTCAAGVLAGWLAAPAAADPLEFRGAGNITRADQLIGRLVETRDGEELGRVRDLAVDLDSGRIGYVVISVGSFLIDDSLVAVEPRALRPTADADGRLVLEADADSLRSARRFGGADWPLRADITAATTRPADPSPAAGESAGADVETAAVRGTAVISDGTRTATLSAGERSIRAVTEDRPANEPAPAEAARSRSAFERLDRHGTGALDRTQIAHELRPGDRYSDIDSNGDGLIQRSEYEAWSRGAAPEAAPQSE
jgi:sporulation protein YlmC with PRC-barrel domain